MCVTVTYIYSCGCTSEYGPSVYCDNAPEGEWVIHLSPISTPICAADQSGAGCSSGASVSSGTSSSSTVSGQYDAKRSSDANSQSSYRGRRNTSPQAADPVFDATWVPHQGLGVCKNVIRCTRPIDAPCSLHLPSLKDPGGERGKGPMVGGLLLLCRRVLCVRPR